MSEQCLADVEITQRTWYDFRVIIVHDVTLWVSHATCCATCEPKWDMAVNVTRPQTTTTTTTITTKTTIILTYIRWRPAHYRLVRPG